LVRSYHTLDLPTGRVEGVWDLTGRFTDYTGGVDVHGKTVLDVGAASGYLTFEAEKRGGTVTSLDIESADQFHLLPFAHPDDQRDRWFREWRLSYQHAHRALRSSANRLLCDVYDIGPHLGAFQVVMVGQLLVHLSDAVRALQSCASVCTETLVVTEGNLPYEAPVAALCARADRPDIP
jgi:hypothetical protein